MKIKSIFKTTFVGFLAFTVSGIASISASANGNLSISRQAGPWPINIRTCTHDAAAICGLTWRNREFVDDFDHGRQIQSAVVYDRRGEGFNPTEAGGSYDGHNPRPSSSVILGTRKDSASQLSTQANMAFWLTVNGRRQSNTIHSKNVKIGAFGLPHVIEYNTSFRLPSNENHNHAQFEIVTGYMPFEFSRFSTYDPRTRVLAPLSVGPGEQSRPVILSTQDGGWAMGIYANRYKSFGRWKFNTERVTKWNHVGRINNPTPGRTYSFRSYVIVGSLDNVRTSMDQLYRIVGF